MLRCGLLGKKLGHSYSPQIHRMLAEERTQGAYRYELYEKTPEEVEDFVLRGDWHGLNVTIPYKKTVLPLCNQLGADAARTGSVNTLVRRPDGSIFGDNTDVAGFRYLLADSGIDVAGKKVLVLGSGGASAAVCAALEDAGAAATVISRRGENNYDALERHADAAVIVNTTPVGMYPDNLQSPISLAHFPALAGVIDVIYNPARTQLLMEAEARGLSFAGGLSMLVAQAARSAELFLGSGMETAGDEGFSKGHIQRITDLIKCTEENIVLVGMPGCGKSTVAHILGAKLQRPVIDTDDCISQRTGKTPEEILMGQGETVFRTIESEVLCEAGKRSGAIIATGGGCVTREENYAALHQNGTIVWIRRDTDQLPRDGRPLSAGDLAALYAARAPLYARFADHIMENTESAEKTAGEILKILERKK